MKRRRRETSAVRRVTVVASCVAIGHALVDLVLLGCAWAWMPTWQGKMLVIGASTLCFAAAFAGLWLVTRA